MKHREACDHWSVDHLADGNACLQGTTAALVTALLAVVVVEGAQRSTPPAAPQIDTTSVETVQTSREAAAADGYDGGFRFCRIRFATSTAGDGDRWYRGLSARRIRESVDASSTTDQLGSATAGEGEPIDVVPRLTDAKFDAIVRSS